jgi:hypothetical protein
VNNNYKKPYKAFLIKKYNCTGAKQLLITHEQQKRHIPKKAVAHLPFRANGFMWPPEPGLPFVI